MRLTLNDLSKLGMLYGKQVSVQQIDAEGTFDGIYRTDSSEAAIYRTPSEHYPFIVKCTGDFSPCLYLILRQMYLNQPQRGVKRKSRIGEQASSSQRSPKLFYFATQSLVKSMLFDLQMFKLSDGFTHIGLKRCDAQGNIVKKGEETIRRYHIDNMWAEGVHCADNKTIIFRSYGLSSYAYHIMKKIWLEMRERRKREDRLRSYQTMQATKPPCDQILDKHGVKRKRDPEMSV